MADITIYKPAGMTLNVVDGDPPADQSAQIAALTAKIDAGRAEAQALKAADAATVDGQRILDALA